MIGFGMLWALALLPLPLGVRAWMAPRPGRGGAGLVVPEGLAARLADAGAAAAWAGAARGALPWIIWGALVLALAQPRVVAPQPLIGVEGRDIVLAIDLSGSMEQKDFVLDGAPARRLDVVARVAADFVRGRVGDRVGLVVFGDTAYVAAPPSFDVAAVARSVEGMVIGLAGRSTAIADGLGLALKRLEGSDAPGRVVILLSDGANTAGRVDPVAAAGLAASLGIRVHTIAMGPQARSEGASARGAVDDITLAAIAQAAGGRAFRVRSSADMAEVAAELDRMETSPTEAPRAEVYRALWPWPAAVALAAALVCLGLDLGRGGGWGRLMDRWRRLRPGAAGRRSVPGGAAAAGSGAAVSGAAGGGGWPT